MKLEQETISPPQYYVLICAMVFGVALVFTPTQQAKNLSWLAILVGAVEGLLLYSLFSALYLRHPGKTLIEINERVFGKNFGKLISLSYLWYFTHLASLNLISFGDFFHMLYPETPLFVLLLAMIVVCVAVLRAGIGVLTRCGLIIVPIMVFFYISDTFLLIQDMDLNNLLPFRNVALQDFLCASHAVGTVQFGELIVLLMVTPLLTDVKTIKSGKYALLFAAFFVALAIARNTAVLGVLKDILIYPTFHVLQLINIADILTRLEILVVVNFFFIGFIKISVMYYAAVFGTAQLLRMRTYRPLLIPFGVLIIILSFLNFDSSHENFIFASNVYPYYALPFQLFFPLAALLLSRRKNKKKKVK